jgi:hypothetical protein
MRYLKPISTTIEINNETYNLRYTLDVIDELQDKTKIPLPELISFLYKKRYQKDAIRVLLKYLTGQMIDVEDDKLDYYSTLLIQTYINQLMSKPYDGEKKGEVKNEFEFINIERHFYIATVILKKSDEQAWGMTLSEINTLFKEHSFEMGWIKADKEVNIDDVI